MTKSDEEMLDPFGHGEFVRSRMLRIQQEDEMFRLGCDVIKAAKKLVEKWTGDRTHLGEGLNELAHTVEALAATEGRE